MKEIQEIAERLKGIREMEEISTAEMAECAGISENEYINYESGKKDFTFTLLYNCAKNSASTSRNCCSENRRTCRNIPSCARATA